MEENKQRKRIRIQANNCYNDGIFFLTICTKERRCFLSRIHECENGLYNTELLPYGAVVEKYITQFNKFYDHISIENYVIMPNHIHIIIYVKNNKIQIDKRPGSTKQNNSVSSFISTLKRFINKEIGFNIWQRGSYDHIIRNGIDFDEHMRYIYENPRNWYFDDLYSEE